MLVCLGVVPVGVDHPQVARLGDALARSGFAALLYWSPAMRDLRLDPADVPEMAHAFDRLIAHAAIDPTRCGLLGTCVGGGFALRTAAEPAIRDRVSFVTAFAPFASMFSLAEGIASATRLVDGERVSWPVDQLTRRVFVRSLTEHLDPTEAEALRQAASDEFVPAEPASALSEAGRAVYPLLTRLTPDAARDAIDRLPTDMRERFTALSPLASVAAVRARLVTIGHDRDDLVVPVGESRQLRTALSTRAGVRYTEFSMFQHADPTQRKLSPLALARELSRFYAFVWTLYLHVTRPTDASCDARSMSSRTGRRMVRSNGRRWRIDR
jgi:hypothetical protein